MRFYYLTTDLFGYNGNKFIGYEKNILLRHGYFIFLLFIFVFA